MQNEMRKYINKVKNFKQFENSQTINEFYGGGESENIHQIKKTGATLTKQQEEFLAFATNYYFKDTVKTFDVKNRKILGITIKKENIPSTKDIFYNDFTFSIRGDGNLNWTSGASGTYRPEGYMWGDSTTDKSIENRLQYIIDLYNNANGTSLKIDGDKIIL